MPICNKCGSEVANGDQFCLSCGAPVSSQAESPAAVEETVREKAERRVKERMELLRHIGMYVIVNGFLVVIWALSGAGYPWFLWVMAGWGLGLLIHVFTYLIGLRSESVRSRMIAREMEKIEKTGDKE